MANEELNGADIESVKRRIAKLLAIAADGRGDVNEAASAAAMAERLMRKFQLDNAEVLIEELRNKGDAFGEEIVAYGMDPEGRVASSVTWSGMLALAVGRLYDCNTIGTRTARHGHSISFRGYKVDAQMARQTYVALVNIMAVAVRGAQRSAVALGRRESEAFRRGFIVALTDSLKKADREKRAEMQQAGNSRELVLVKSRAVEERYGKCRSRSVRSSAGGNAFAEGRAQGSRVDVTRRGLGDDRASAARIGA